MLVVIAVVGLTVSAAWLAGLTLRNPQAQQSQASPPKGSHGEHVHPSIPANYANAHIPTRVWTDPKTIAKCKAIITVECAVCYGGMAAGWATRASNLPRMLADTPAG